MQFWEFVLRQDALNDIADPTAGKKWANQWERSDEWLEPWNTERNATWTQAVHALRSIAPRLKNKRGRPSELAPAEADGVFNDYLGFLRPIVTTSNNKPLRASNYRGLRFVVWQVEDPVHRLWASVFASMITYDFTRVCEKCGQPMPLTPTGKQPRASKCSKCRFNDWYSRQPKKQLRARWRAAKASQREQEG